MNDSNLNNKILEKFKRQIAISNFKNDLKMKKEKHFNFLFNKVAAILLIVFMLTGATWAAKQILMRFENNEMVYSLGSVKDSINNGYVENIDMDYTYSDNIGIKATSLMLSDNDFSVTFDFDFPKSNVPESMLRFGFIIYDDNNNVYYSDTPNLSESNKKIRQLYEEIGVNYDKNDLLGNLYANGCESQLITVTDNKVINQLLLTAQTPFPKTNNIYIKLFDIGYLTELGTFRSITKAEWNLKISIPEKFNDRNSINFTLKDKIDNFEIVSAYVSETSMTIIAKTKDSGSLLGKITVMDKDGKVFTAETSASIIDENTFITRYSLNKDTLPKQLYIKVKIDGKETTTELIRK